MLLVLQFALFGLLVVGQAVPDRPIVNHLLAAVEDGTYGPNAMIDRMGGVSDTFTECVVVGTGLGASPEESAFDRAVRMPRIGNCAGGAGDLQAIAEGAVIQDSNYYKYWAGYTVITRPVLALMGLEGLRIVAGTLMLLAAVGAFLAVRARTTTAVALGLILPLLVGTNLLSTPSTSFSQSISIAFVFLSVLLTAVGSGRSIRLGGYGALLGAALFCYVDLLTTPAVPWAMSAFVLGAVVWFRTDRLRDAFVGVLVGGAVWPAAFGITWVSRWVFGAVFLGFSETFDTVQENVGFRTGGEHEAVSEALGAGTLSNAIYWWRVLPTAELVLIGCLVTVAAGLFLALRRAGLTRWAVAVVLALPAFAVPFWYEALSNHSQIHALFTYRGIPTALAIGTAACLTAAARPTPAPTPGPGPTTGAQRDETKAAEPAPGHDPTPAPDRS